MITRLHHAQITVSEGGEDAARAFYCGVLGLLEVQKPDSLAGRGGFWVGVGDQQVHIGTEVGIDRAATKAHLAYEVQDLEHWRRQLQQVGIIAVESVPMPGFTRFEFRDPFGNRIELIQVTS